MESPNGSSSGRLSSLMSLVGRKLISIGPTVLGLALAGHLGLELYHIGPKLKEVAAVRALIYTYADAIQSVQVKVGKIRDSQLENARLKAENTRLIVQLESKQFECALKAASDMTKTRGLVLNQETGTRVGRTLASLTYKIPEKLSHAQLYTLGVNSIREQQVEKTAAIFSTLTGLEPEQVKQAGSSVGHLINQENKYRTARNYLIAGVAWYSLDNYNLSNYYLGQTLKTAPSVENIPYHAQAKLWKAIILKRLQKEPESQAWLRQLLVQHPRSAEVSWIYGSGTHHASEAKQ